MSRSREPRRPPQPPPVTHRRRCSYALLPFHKCAYHKNLPCTFQIALNGSFFFSVESPSIGNVGAPANTLSVTRCARATSPKGGG